jgi:hypothetical protein
MVTRQAVRSAAHPLAQSARSYERPIMATMMMDTLRPRHVAPRRISVAFKLLPKSKSTVLPGSDSKSPPARKITGDDAATTVCVSYRTASVTKDEGRPAPGEAAAFRMPPPDFHWAMSDTYVAVAHCTFTVQAIRATDAPPSSQRFEVTLAWDPQGKDELSSTDEITQFLQRPELLELFRYLAPARET